MRLVGAVRSPLSKELPMLSRQQINAFEEEGFIVVEELFDSADFHDLKSEFTAVVDARAHVLQQAGKLTRLWADESFETRVARIAEEAPEVSEALQTRAHKGPALFAFMKHEKILDRIESLLGSEILCHPSYNLHPRLPGIATSSHQDAGYYLPDGDATLIVACLIPLVDTTPEGGCLWVAPRRHREGVLHHVQGTSGLDVGLEAVPAAHRLPVPTRAGSMIIFSSMLPHGSLVNRSDRVRWSMDLRYQKLGEPTGRWYVPGFVARSRANPQSECADWRTWVEDVERVDRWAATQPERTRSRWQ